MKSRIAARIALALAAAFLGTPIVDAQPQSQAQSQAAPAWKGWQGCCGVTPWGYGAGMMMGGGHGGMMGGYGGGHGGMMGGSAARNHAAMMGGVPAAYANLQNPLPQTATTIERGAKVYADNCASCHGPTGYGDGPAASGLNPRPANLAWLSRMPMSRWDSFMFWTVSEGGAPFGTAMPSFKTSLSEADRWAAIAYVQAHLPQPKGGR